MNTVKEQSQPIIQVENICKNFGPTKALSDVSLSIFRGKVTGLIGENGSGKSTLTSIISGMQAPTSGTMKYNGNAYQPTTMLDAAAQGVGMIVQEQGYVSGITVAQNIFLGEEHRFMEMGVIRAKKMNHAARQALDAIGFKKPDPTMLIDALDPQDRKLVEIARIMYHNPELLVVDETTTALSQTGREILYGILEKMKAENKAVIFISHDLDELMVACDCLAVLRDGVLIDTLEKEQMNDSVIKRLMVGREMSDNYYRVDYDTPVSEEVVLDVNKVTSGTGLLMNFSMQVHAGEILGIGGLSHCGMHELGRVLFGCEPLLTGSVTHTKTGTEVKSSRVGLKLGMGYVSKNRDLESLILAASIKDNIVMGGLDKIKVLGPFTTPSMQTKYVKKQVEALSIKCASATQAVQFLSGGNKQKVAFAKWIARECDILILDCPTRGVDIGVKAAMYQLMNEMKQQGKTIIMISEEMPELIGMSDRILVLKNGKLSAEFNRRETLSEHEIIEFMI